VGSLLAVSITETVLAPPLATYTLPPSALTATPTGSTPTGIVAATVLVTASITEIVLSLEFGTYTLTPSGATATPKGKAPTGIPVNPCPILTPWWVDGAFSSASNAVFSSSVSQGRPSSAIIVFLITLVVRERRRVSRTSAVLVYRSAPPRLNG
jgi:hypothetical protein